MEKLILIDGNAIMHRAFHAYPPFKTKSGELVNAVYGFGSMLLSIINNERPRYIAVSFDTKAKTFRHEEYKEYKATRVKAPDEFYAQIPKIKDLVKTFNIPIYEIDGYEADDVLGTLSLQASKDPDIVSYIVTGDMDTLQLVTDKIFVLSPIKGLNEYKIYDRKGVFEKYGLYPEQIADMKGLKGDSSDNIKGVQGIGEKTTERLLQKYGHIENIYDHLNEIEGKAGVLLRDQKSEAFFSKKLATIIKEVPIKLEIENCKTGDYDLLKIEKFFEDLEFKSLVKKLKVINDYYSVKNKHEISQGTLF